MPIKSEAPVINSAGRSARTISASNQTSGWLCLMFLVVCLPQSVYALGTDTQESATQESIGAEETADQLLRLSYLSEVTGLERDYFVYLPHGYQPDSKQRWPVIFFLHGNGQRGDAKDDLDYILRHGPLMEAWIQRRKLPYIIVSPQLPLFGELEAIEDRKIHPRPERVEEGVPERNYGYPSSMPIQRESAEQFPPGPHSAFDPFAVPDNLPQGWFLIDDELISILDTVLDTFQADANRVYLSGVSLGGFGTFHMAAKYPERWAAIAPVVGVGKLDDARKIAEAKIPVWMFGGGKDAVVKPHWLYETARALEEADIPVLRFTVHEDMDHDAWKRVYEGNDLFEWFLRYNNQQRPQVEKSFD